MNLLWGVIGCTLFKTLKMSNIQNRYFMQPLKNTFFIEKMSCEVGAVP